MNSISGISGASVTLPVVQTVSDYVDAFVAGRRIQVSGLQGRLVRGRHATDFETLTDDPVRRIVMLMGSDGLEALPGHNGYGMLKVVGHTAAHIRAKVEQGNGFKLAVFPAHRLARPATWGNVISIVGSTYPAAVRSLRVHQGHLQVIPFAAIQKQAGFSFHDVAVAGARDPRYMTYERFMRSNQDLVSLRLFLYCTVRLCELYGGDGYTVDHDGNRGVSEFLVHDVPLRQLGDYRLLDIDVQLPRT